MVSVYDGIPYQVKQGQAIGASLPNIWKSHSIPISTKIRSMKALVWPVATYSRESWTFRKNEKTRLETFEMKALRDSVGFVDIKEKQMNGFLTKLE